MVLTVVEMLLLSWCSEELHADFFETSWDINMLAFFIFLLSLSLDDHDTIFISKILKLDYAV